MVAYCTEGINKAKLFVKSPSDVDTVKLRQLLDNDKTAPIYLYVDTLDQSYVQRTIPTASAIGIASIAKKRLDKEVPKGYLKACIQLERTTSGRKDFIYTFMSTPLEPPLTLWLDFFMPYMNIIQGIFLLPVELYGIIQKFKLVADMVQSQSIGNRIVQPLNFKQKLALFFPYFSKALQQGKTARWELFISHNKTGGFRQVAFHDGKIIFSRLLNNIDHQDADVVAGNIEQEVANSIEYLVRLSLSGEEKVDMYIIVAEEIQKFIRVDKLKASRVFQYTPFQFAERLGLKDSALPKDKFSDPSILTAMSSIGKRRLVLHTPITEKVYKFTKIISYIRIMLGMITPILILAALVIFNNIFGLRSSINYVINQSSAVKVLIEQNSKVIKETENKIGQDISIDQLNEIVDYYLFMTKQQINPTEVINQLSLLLPDTVRIKTLKWSLTDTNLTKTKYTEKNPIYLTLKDIAKPMKYVVKIDTEIILNDYGKTIEELQKKYAELIDLLTKNFPDYKVNISALPQIYGLQSDISKPILLTANFVKVFDPASNIARTSAPALVGAKKYGTPGAGGQTITFDNKDANTQPNNKGND